MTAKTSRPPRRPCRPAHSRRQSHPARSRACGARAFSLLELVAVMLVMVCLVAWYIRITDEADSLSQMLRGHEESAVQRGPVRERPARLIDLRQASAAQRRDADAVLDVTIEQRPDLEGGGASESLETANSIAVY